MNPIKHFFIAAISVFLFTGAAFSQMVTTDPAMPTMTGVTKIFYDTSGDPGELHNYTGDIYVHTGVTINNVRWQKVIGSWGNNSSQPRLVYRGNYRYELDITPDIKTFYLLSAADIVTEICLVFRNAAGTLQTRPDIFLNIYQAGLNASIILPEKYFLVTELNNNIIIKAAATSADSISLYINNQFIKSGLTPDLVTDTITADIYGEFWVKAVAWKKPSFAADSFFFYVRKPVVSEELPSGLNDGINYTSGSSVTLVLHAPYKSYVFATGDFTGWLAREKGYMKKTPDGERYWLEINSLEPGKEYRFQYLVDDTLSIAEPYADKVLDPWNDQYISPATYPGLTGYPKDTASGIVSVLQTNQVPYTWQATGYQPPQKSGLVIYELLVRDFVANHDYKTLMDTLNYLDDLGVNAIELMPITEFEGNSSWGYNISFHFAPDKYYGPKNDLKAFVDSCHNRGIAVIMDMVLNHCFGQSPFVQLYLDHYGSDQIYMKLPNPWFNASSPNPVYKWGADFNHLSPSTQELVDRVCAYWLTEYKIDGFRFDFTKGFTNTPGDGSSYDPSRIAILERMAGKIWQLKPEAYVILEHFGPSDEETELANYGMMLWGNINYNYAEAAMGYDSDLTFGTYSGRGWTVPNLVSYMESHDEERLMFKTITWGNSAGSYDTKEFSTAIKRMELGAVFFLTIPGPKMIWQFGEVGYDFSIDYGGRVSEKPIRWDYFSDPARHRLYTVYRLLNNLRKTQPAFGTVNFTYSLSTAQKRVTLDHATMKVNVLGNFGVTEAFLTPGFPQTGKWYEYFTGDSLTVTDINDPLDFQPGEYRLYTTKKLEPSGLASGIDDLNLQGSEKFVTVYPNPSSGDFIFLMQNETPTDVIVMVYDLTGKMIRKLKTEIPGGGTQTFTWDGRSEAGTAAPEGIYLIHVQTPGKSQTLKVIKSEK